MNSFTKRSSRDENVAATTESWREGIRLIELALLRRPFVTFGRRVEKRDVAGDVYLETRPK